MPPENEEARQAVALADLVGFCETQAAVSPAGVYVGQARFSSGAPVWCLGRSAVADIGVCIDRTPFLVTHG
jgi:hypothetical protein